MTGHSARTAALTFQDIDIVRMEGIRDTYRMDRLSPGINLIHGPNGIGKSRTAIALQSLLWPGAFPGRAEIIGNVVAGDEPWRVELDGGRAAYQRNGVPETAQVLVSMSAEHRDRYLLTLHDLLRADNRDFAREIVREAAGGYDFEHVRRELGVAAAFARPRRLVGELRQAEDAVVALRRADQELQGQERSLEALRTEQDRAVSAFERVRLLECGRAHAEALADLAERRVVRDAFPDAVRRMTGDEYAVARQLRDQLAAMRTRSEQLALAIERDSRELSATGFADKPMPGTLIQVLRHRLEQAQRHLIETQQAARQQEAAAALFDASRRRLAAEITEQQISTLDAGGLRALSTHVAEMREVRQAMGLQEQIRQWLGEIEHPGDLETLRRGVDVLQQYLGIARARSGEQKTQQQWVLMGAAAVIVVQAVGLAVTASIWLLALGLIAIPLALIAIRPGETSDDEPRRLRADYTRLALDEPGTWALDQVQNRLAELQRELAEAVLEEQKFHRWEALAGKRQETAARWRELNQRNQELLATYGVIAGDHDPDSLRLIAEAVDKWRQASDGLVESRAKFGTAARLLDETLESISRDIQEYGGDAVTDVSMAASAVEHLATRVGNAERLTASINQARHRLDDELKPEIQQLEHQLAAVYEAAGVEPNDDVGLRTFCDRVEDFIAAQKACDAAEAIVRTRRAEVEGDLSLLELSREEIDRELADAEALAIRRDEIQSRIAEIETRLRQAREQTHLEEAIAKHAQAHEGLQGGRQREYEDVAARNLVAFIQERNHHLNRPVVLRIADEYFTIFTSGAYTLTVGEGPDADFLAIDTTSGRAHTLDELSSGTRVQLLLAVRLAFIEVTERGVQVPIMLDEVLGNTDDERATAIIDATIEIARRGRQVFYFTAQRDEIGKWFSRLEAHDDAPASRRIDLAEVRKVSRRSSPSHFAWDTEVFKPSDLPEGASYEELHEALAVAPVDFWAERPDGCSLWYFVPDAASLARLHRRGVHTWGQYLALARVNRLDGIWTEALHARALARAGVIEAVCREWRYGRARPVSREALQASSLITDRFRAEVLACAESCSWDGQSLIDALSAGQVSGFRRTAITGLEEWFREDGHIVDGGPRADHLVRASALSAAADAVDRGILDEAEVDDLVMSMGGAPAMAS